MSITMAHKSGYLKSRQALACSVAECSSLRSSKASVGAAVMLCITAAPTEAFEERSEEHSATEHARAWRLLRYPDLWAIVIDIHSSGCYSAFTGDMCFDHLDS